MTLQEIFDKSCGGIIAQGGPAIQDNRCCYRTVTGRKCAAGQLIPDDKYSSAMEGKLVNYDAVSDACGITAENQVLINCLQKAHDSSAFDGEGVVERGYVRDDSEFLRIFKAKALKIAENFKLGPAILG